MSSWFRMYDDVLDDPKVQRLPAETFRGWVNLLCLAKRHDGILPSIQDISFALRLTEQAAYNLLGALRNAGLIDDVEEGPEPHNWRSRQFKSDVSNERVKQFRKRSKQRDGNGECNGAGNVTGNGDETPRARTDSETDTEKKERALLRNEQLAPLESNPGDLKSTIWNTGLAWLMRATGRTQASLRTVLGKWCRNHPEEQVWACMCAAQRDEVVEPIAWIEQALRTRAGKSRHNALNGYRGQDELMEVLNGHAGEDATDPHAISGEDDRRLLAAAPRPG